MAPPHWTSRPVSVMDSSLAGLPSTRAYAASVPLGTGAAGRFLRQARSNGSAPPRGPVLPSAAGQTSFLGRPCLLHRWLAHSQHRWGQPSQYTLHDDETLSVAPGFSRRWPSRRPALATVAAAEAVPESPPPPPLLQPQRLRLPFGDREIVLETGRIGRQAAGAVLVEDGETVLYTTVCAGEEASEPMDFVPLSVHYQEKYSAAGRTSGGFFKREMRPRDHEVLICRLIDRPIRPMLQKGFPHEVQILSWVLSYDGVHPTEPLAITAAGAALAISEIPLQKPVAGVRVAMTPEGTVVVNPTVEQLKDSRLDLTLAGTAEAVLMIEGFCDFLTEEEMLVAIEAGQAVVSEMCVRIAEWAAEVGKAKSTAGIRHLPPDLVTSMESLFSADVEAALRLPEKQARAVALKELGEKALLLFTRKGQATSDSSSDWDEELWNVSEDGELPVVEDSNKEIEPLLPDETVRRRAPRVFKPMDIKKAYKNLTSLLMRKLVVLEGRRSDGRGPADIRRIESSCAVLSRPHGSALFTRGETQALAVATLGGEDMAQRLDMLQGQALARFYLQYSFPHSSVGETGRVGGPGRREVGHGNLAERSLKPVLPSEDEFPYTMRVESTITESNGSSSMASVCGGCLALLDAGVPLKAPVAGVAMGLVLDTAACGGTGAPLILSDILGSEDALGDMDFKVAGTSDAITAFQMDIKVEGITIPVMRAALAQAKVARQHILGEMEKCSPTPRRALSNYAPRISVLHVPTDAVALVIGGGGRTIRSITEESGAQSIDIDDTGRVTILAQSDEQIAAARERINNLTIRPEVGSVFRNATVKSIVHFGAFVEYAPGKEALVHISELNTERVAKVEDFVKEGDRLDVKVIEFNDKGQMRMSHKALLLEADGGNGQAQTGAAVQTGAKSAPKTAAPRPQSSTSWVRPSPKSPPAKELSEKKAAPKQAAK